MSRYCTVESGPSAEGLEGSSDQPLSTDPKDN